MGCEAGRVVVAQVFHSKKNEDRHLSWTRCCPRFDAHRHTRPEMEVARDVLGVRSQASKVVPKRCRPY